MTRARWLAIATALLGCSVPDLSAPKPGDRFIVELQGAWSSGERAMVARSYDLWREASHGKIDVYVAKPGEDADATLVRGPVRGDGYEDYSRANRWMRIDADALARDGWTPRDGVGALAGSLVGRMLGMERHHGPGFLSYEDVTPKVTDADLAACRSAGFC